MGYVRKSMKRILAGNSYPGRGIVIGKSSDGKKAMFAYFIMGRSENSRNRIFKEEGDTVTIYPFDASKVPIRRSSSIRPSSAWRTTSSSRTAIRRTPSRNISRWASASAVRSRRAPLSRTRPTIRPRISGIIHLKKGGFTYEMSILKSADGKGEKCNRFTFDYEPVNGTGHFLHTYEKTAILCPPSRATPSASLFPTTSTHSRRRSGRISIPRTRFRSTIRISIAHLAGRERAHQ